MIPAEVVGTPERIHPGGQHRFFVSKGASSARQGRQGAHKGGIEPSIEAVLITVPPPVALSTLAIAVVVPRTTR
jgi:hypothetical protein